MNDELLTDRIERRAAEWSVGAPPFQEILGEGRRLRRRRRTTWAAAAAALVFGTVGVATVLPDGAVPWADQSLVAVPVDGATPDAGPVARGQWVGVDGYAIDIPAEWDGDVVACGEALWVAAADSEQACGSTDNPVWVSFERISVEKITELTGTPPKPFTRETSGRRHSELFANCFFDDDGEGMCGAGVHFEGMLVTVSTRDRAHEAEIKALAQTITVLPDEEFE